MTWDVSVPFTQPNAPRWTPGGVSWVLHGGHRAGRDVVVATAPARRPPRNPSPTSRRRRDRGSPPWCCFSAPAIVIASVVPIEMVKASTTGNPTIRASPKPAPRAARLSTTNAGAKVGPSSTTAVQFWIVSAMMISPRKAPAAILDGPSARRANASRLRRIHIPSSTGTTVRATTCSIVATIGTSTARVPSPKTSKAVRSRNGIVSHTTMLLRAVNVTDSARSASATCTTRLLVVPPGEAASSTMLTAKTSSRPNTAAVAKPSSGSTTNWLESPTATARGVVATRRKSWTVRAMPTETMIRKIASGSTTSDRTPPSTLPPVPDA